MESDEVLAEAFAAKYRDRLSWRKEHRFGGTLCWHCQTTGSAKWLPLNSHTFPLQILTEFAEAIGEDTSAPERLRLVLEMAKKYLKN